MVYKTFKVNSTEIYKNNRYNLPKKGLIGLIPFTKFEGHYGGKIDDLEGKIGVFLTPYIYFPASCENQISDFKNIDELVDISIKESDIESYFNIVSDLEDFFETDLTVGTNVENRKWILSEEKCQFLGISDDRTDIEILINDNL